MAEKETAAIVTPEETPAEDAAKQTEQDVETRLKALEETNAKLLEENNRYRGNISKKDKDLAALEREKSALEREKMSAEEKAKAEAEETKTVYINELIETKAEALGLDEANKSLLEGNSGQEVKEKAEKLKDYKATILKEANLKIEALQKEIETMKGNMPDPGSGDKTSGGLADLSTADLNALAAKEPARTEEIIAEIQRRNQRSA